MSPNSTIPVFPHDSTCGQLNDIGRELCPLTSNMVSFLNLTQSYESFFSAYCLNPPSDDGCPWGYCPNGDIGGPLVRISAYLTNIFISTLIFYVPEQTRDSVWSQIFTVYSILIATVVSIAQHQLTRIHAILSAATAGSPLSLYISVYSIRTMFCGSGHRLDPAVGPGRIIPRTLVLAGLGVWIALVVYVNIPSMRFAQQSCEQLGDREFVTFFFIIPFILIGGLFSPFGQWLITLPLQLTCVSWIIAIFYRRKEIWPKGGKFSIRSLWRSVRDNYAFIYYWTIVIIPFSYWVMIVEFATLEVNESFSASFGQLLALMVSVPPGIQVLMLSPRLWRWFIDLTWIRFITCRRKAKHTRNNSSINIMLEDAAFGEDDYYHEYKVDVLSEVQSSRHGSLKGEEIMPSQQPLTLNMYS